MPTPDLLNPYFNEVIRGIEERARAARLVTSIRDVPPGLSAAEAAAEWVRGEKVRGSVVFGGILPNDELRRLAASRAEPLIAINQAVNDSLVLCINIDCAAATRQATHHLMELAWAIWRWT